MTDHLAVLEEVVADIRAHCNPSNPESDDEVSAAYALAWADRITAAIALMRGQSWKDIATAPKDGSYVLVANSHGSWIAKWHPVYQTGYRPSNPWASMMLNHDHIEKPCRFDAPTHWQPLPTPPKDPADEQ